MHGRCLTQSEPEVAGRPCGEFFIFAAGVQFGADFNPLQANVIVAVARINPVVSIPIISSVLAPRGRVETEHYSPHRPSEGIAGRSNTIGVANPIGLLASASVNIIVGVFVGSATYTLSGLVGQIIAGGDNPQGLGVGDPLTKALASVSSFLSGLLSCLANPLAPILSPNANNGALARAITGLLALAGPLMLGGSSPASVNALITILAAIVAAITNLKTLIGSCPTCATDPQFLGKVSGLLDGLALPGLPGRVRSPTA
ncbi:hypothetical protein B0H14DRAFT_3130442 [Mycena olivaceomarginata]|nr:hypothetical protein B0H14DRAFT_3130442 [Mycena olivaceomarginata]